MSCRYRCAMSTPTTAATDRSAIRHSAPPPSRPSPAIVLPGTVLTLALDADTSDARRGRPTRRRVDGRLLLAGGDETTSASSPTSRTSAPCRAASRPRSSRSSRGPASPATPRTAARGPRSPRSSCSPTPRPRRRSTRPPASCASCSSRSPSCAAPAACPRSCAPRARRARRRGGHVGRAPSRSPSSCSRAVERRDRVDARPLRGPRTTWPSCRSPQQIRADVTEGMDKQQREFLLRQQLPAIRKELGEGDDDVVGEYRTKLADARRCRKACNAVAKEIDRLERTSAAVARARLDPHVAGPHLRAAVERAHRRPARPRPRRARCSTPTTTASTT